MSLSPRFISVLNRIQTGSKWIRAIFLIGFLGIAAGALFISNATVMAPAQRELHPGVHLIEIRNRAFSFLFQHQLAVRFEAERLADFDIFLNSRIGHLQVDSPSSYLLPVFFRDQVVLKVTGPSTGVVRLAEARLVRRFLPGGWAIVGVLLTGMLYFHGLARGELSGPKFGRFMLLAGSCGAGLVFSALAAQMLGPSRAQRQEPWQLFPPNLDQRISIHPDITPGIPPGIVRFKTSSEGIRAKERGEGFERVFSVLCVGASTTECLLLGEENHWPRVLERHLEKSRGTNVWVGNAGHSGYPTARLNKVAENYLPRIRPKYLVVLTGYNEGIVPDEPTVEADHALRSGEWVERIDQVVLLRLLRRVLFNYSTPSPNDVYFGESNRTLEQARQNYQLAGRLTPPRERTWENLDLSGFEQGLRRFHELATRHGARLILCTQPTIYRADLTPRELNLLWMMGNFTPTSKRRRMDLVNERTRRVASELGVAVVDLDRELPRTTEVFFDDCHFNVGGASRVGQAVYECIARLEKWK